MSTVPPSGAISNDPSITTTTHEDEDVLDFLARFARELDEQLPRIKAACERYDAKVKAQRASDEAPTTDRDAPHIAGLAFRSDGKTLLHVAHLCAPPIGFPGMMRARGWVAETIKEQGGQA